MKVLHVIPDIGEEASGPAHSVPRLCQSLVELGNEVELICSGADKQIPGVILSLYPRWPALTRFSVSPQLIGALKRGVSRVDIVHNHSLWAMINIAAGLLVPGHQAKLVTSPRGTLSSWSLAQSKRRKQVAWPVQRPVLASADLLHATSETEYAEIRRLGLAAPVVIVPNGIDVPPPIELTPESEPRTLLFLSRIHPIKGIDRLLYAWQSIEARHPDWQLTIAGRGDAEYVRAVTGLATSLGLQRVLFPGPIYGGEKSRAYARARLFILPTHSENFGMVVAEALAHGCPAVVSQEAPWAGLDVNGCGWWVRHDVRTLADTLDHAMSLPPEQLAAMGRKGRVWMQRDFSWAAVGQQMEAAYRWVITRRERPNWIRVD